MSFFYLSPVKGEMQVYLLELIVRKRLEYLKGNIESTAYNEFVVEGSLYDNVGHYMLCILTILSKNRAFKDFICKTEVNLFKRRLESLSSYDLRCFAKKLLQKIKREESVPLFIDALEVLCQHLLVKSLAQHVCYSAHSKSCSVHTIPLNFKHCLPFVAKRQVELKNGIALLPCSLWKHCLVLLFSSNLRYRLNQSYINSLETDPRITDLLNKITKDIPLYLFNNQYDKNILQSKDVDRLSQFFPPCMLNLHQNLRTKHRLSHLQRFYYSLYLKDIGMPVEEAMSFWKAEYQQIPIGNCNNCCHHWDKDEKKFVYGIRHMYGLEGARKNYVSVSCHQIQNAKSSCSEGGCPFTSFEYSNMMKLLNIKDTNSFLRINELIQEGDPTSACMEYLKLKHELTFQCDISNSFNFTPVKYLLMSSKRLMKL